MVLIELPPVVPLAAAASVGATWVSAERIVAVLPPEGLKPTRVLVDHSSGLHHVETSLDPAEVADVLRMAFGHDRP